MVLTKTQKFKNAVLSVKDNEIREIDKNEERSYNLDDVLKEWDGVEGVTITIQLNNNVDENGEIL